ncbi:MAG: D-alanyl-D-alanine carboxypeptidase/D-alanyl-D-alanine-endopeptidase [Trueperella sp.]|nr:D-alanyl-D-alanine carboxypeptidase/D-alanyl-D-alanine-endopeptidase [Trueperella sp.]
MKRVKIAVVVCAVLLGIYTMGDVWGVVPGPLTNEPVTDAAQPYPDMAPADYDRPELPALSDAPSANAAVVANAIAELAGDSRITGQVSAIVVDAQTGSVIAERESNRAAEPASTMKLLTAVAALTELGPDTKLPTSTKIHGKDLYLIGGGDIMLSAGKSNNSAVMGRAGLATLAERTARELQKLNLEEVNLYVDGSLFAEPLYHPGMDPENYRYTMQARPIAVEISRESMEQHLPDGDLTAAQIFADALGESGIKVRKVARQTAPGNAAQIAKVESAPVRDLVEFMMLHSDNAVADTLGHLVALQLNKPANFAGAAAAVLSSLHKQGYDTAGITIADSSGLTTGNRITTKILMEVLLDLWQCDQCPLAAAGAGMPTSGLTGSMYDRFGNTAVRGRVHAKTGSLPEVSALAGFVYTDAGRPLAFAVIVDQLEPGTAYSARLLVDRFVDQIAKA